MPLPCFCQILAKSKVYKNKSGAANHNHQNCADSDCLPLEFESAPPVSASEVSKLKAEVWCLQNSLDDTVEANENMQVLVRNVVQDKYDALDELEKVTHANGVLEAQLRAERDMYAEEKRKLLQEVVQLKEKANRQQEFIVS